MLVKFVLDIGKMIHNLLYGIGILFWLKNYHLQYYLFRSFFEIWGMGEGLKIKEVTENNSDIICQISVPLHLKFQIWSICKLTFTQ